MALLPDKSPRFRPPATGVPDPGPGAYLGSYPKGPAEYVKGGLVERSRRLPINRWKSKLNTPGPGSYGPGGPEPEPLQDTAGLSTSGSWRSQSGPVPDPMGLSTCSFRSNCCRISKDNLKEPLLVPGSTLFQPAKSADNPGPGSYESIGQLRSQTWSYPPPSKPPLMRAKSAPSIMPLKKEVRYTGRIDGIPAPGEYDRELADSALKSAIRTDGPSPDFHASVTKRSVFSPPGESPGPGTYESKGLASKGTSLPFASQTQRSPAAKVGSEKTPGPETSFEPEAKGRQKCFSSYRSDVPRELQQNLLLPFTQPEHYKVPGPGQYPSAPSFQGGRRTQARACPAVPGQEASRRGFHGVHTPLLRTALLQAESQSAARTPFGTTAARPVLVPEMRRVQSDVGQYNAGEALGQSMSSTRLKEQARIGKGGVFGCSSRGERFVKSLHEVEAAEAPAPGHNNPDGVAFRVQPTRAGPPTRTNPSGASLKSAVPQCKGLQPETLPPGPGAYDPGFSAPPKAGASAVAMVKQFSAPKTERVVFGSCKVRFSGPSKEEQEPPKGLEPAVYLPKPLRGPRGGAAKVTSKYPALEPLKAAHPGQDPGSYQAEASKNHSLLRRSYNVAAADPQAARRCTSEPAPPSVGGGAGGGAAGMRVRLGMSLGSFDREHSSQSST